MGFDFSPSDSLPGPWESLSNNRVYPGSDWPVSTHLWLLVFFFCAEHKKVFLPPKRKMVKILCQHILVSYFVGFSVASLSLSLTCLARNLNVCKLVCPPLS